MLSSCWVDWKCRTWKWRTNLQDMKMPDMKMQDMKMTGPKMTTERVDWKCRTFAACVLFCVLLFHSCIFMACIFTSVIFTSSIFSAPFLLMFLHKWLIYTKILPQHATLALFVTCTRHWLCSRSHFFIQHSASWGTEQDVEARMANAGTVYRAMDKLWKLKIIGRPTKVKIFNSN